MMRYALSLSEDNRILSACVILPGGCYDGMPLVDNLPEGDVSEYLYVEGQYVHDPLPVQEPVAEPTADDVLNALLGVM